VRFIVSSAANDIRLRSYDASPSNFRFSTHTRPSSYVARTALDAPKPTFEPVLGSIGAVGKQSFDQAANSLRFAASGDRA